MAKEFSRISRINQQVKQELALVLQREMKDPRLGMVTVNDVDVSRDLNYAKVFVTFFDDEKETIKEKLSVLNNAASYIRTLVAGRLKLRTTPELRFFYDQSLNEGIRMTNLVTKAVRQDQEKKQTDIDPQDKAD
jgi:ribosome-binding factor A